MIRRNGGAHQTSAHTYTSYGHSKGEMVVSYGQSKGANPRRQRRREHPDAGTMTWLAGKERKGHGHKEIGSVAGNAGPDDLEDAARAGAAAWVRNCAAHRASEPRRAPVE